MLLLKWVWMWLCPVKVVWNISECALQSTSIVTVQCVYILYFWKEFCSLYLFKRWEIGYTRAVCYLLYFVHSLINGSDLWLCQLPPLPESLKPGTWQIRITERLFCFCNQRGEEPKHVQTAVCLLLRARHHISSMFLPFYTTSSPAVTSFLQTCHRWHLVFEIRTCSVLLRAGISAMYLWMYQK